MACNEDIRAKGGAYPRTCADCGFGPCKKYPKPPIPTIGTGVALSQVAALLKALEPFARAPMTGSGAFNRAALSDDDFRAARAAIARAEKSEMYVQKVLETCSLEELEAAYCKRAQEA